VTDRRTDKSCMAKDSGGGKVLAGLMFLAIPLQVEDEEGK
jgi:hypothetical protein